jgi:hypothetical protein
LDEVRRCASQTGEEVVFIISIVWLGQGPPHKHVRETQGVKKKKKKRENNKEKQIRRKVELFTFEHNKKRTCTRNSREVKKK